MLEGSQAYWNLYPICHGPTQKSWTRVETAVSWLLGN